MNSEIEFWQNEVKECTCESSKAFMLSFIDSMKEKEDAHKNILEWMSNHNQNSFIGLELKHKSHNKYCVVLEEPGQNKSRAVYFDSRGLIGHFTRKTAAEIVEDLVNEGYIDPVSGKMESLSLTKEWGSGMSNLFAIQAYNEGMIDFTEMSSRLREICKES